jgi:photosystem II stability/assembly factor-like uncharacterized protein
MSSIDTAMGSRGHKRRRFISPFSTLTLLGFLLLLTSCGQNGTGSESSISSVVKADNQRGTNVVAGAFTTLHMINAMIGWAISWDITGSSTYNILKTTDGGRHWKTMLKCLPTQDMGKGFIEGCSTDFHSASVATVVQPEYDSKTQTSRIRVFHTSDGGQTWQGSVINARDLETPAVFVDGLHGWVFATDHFPGSDPASAYIGGQIALYRTGDGGKTWQRIASGPSTSQIAATTDDAYGIPPFAASARMQFVTPSTGWLIGSASHPDMSNYSWLYVTHDGGSSWHKAAISFPAQALALGRPTFFTEQEGLFPVLTSGPAPQYARGTMLYTTQDGGQTWTSTAVPFDVTNAVFIDMNHAVSVGDTDSKAFYTTSDGWKHWTKVRVQTTFKRIYGFDFVSPALGWALADNRTIFLPEPGGGIRKGDVIALLQTRDGGRTWREIAHSAA